MAAEYVGCGGLFHTTGPAIDVDIPAGNNGELLVLVTLNNSTGTCPTPAGWTTGLDISIPAANSTTTQTTTRIKYRERDGTEGGVVNIDPSGVCDAYVIAVSGANMDNPLGAYQTEASILTDQITIPSPGFMKSGQMAIASSTTSAASASDTPTGVTNLSWTEAIDAGNGVGNWAVNVAETTGDTYCPGQQVVATSAGAHACIALTFFVNPDDVRDEFITGTGTSSFNVPAGVNGVTLCCIGAGGGGSVNTGAEGGGGGGAYSQTNNLACGDADTIYRSVPPGGAVATAGGDCWLRLNTNSAPSSTTDGCLAKGGSGGSGSGNGGGAGGVTSTGVGDVKFAGGAGANGQGGGGTRAGSGGGSSAGYTNTGNNGTAGSGSTQGPGGLSTASGHARGGYGGNSAAAGIVGFTPGGGGGGGGNSGGNAGAGAQGRCRMIFTLTPPATVGRATETDTASARGMAAGHGQSNETDSAFARTAVVVRATGMATETDTAFRVAMAHGVNRANETDSAFALSQGVIQIPVGQANETDTAFKAGGIAMAPNRPIETDTAFNRGTVLQVQRANETDQAFQLTRLGGVGVAIEADTAFALGKVFILPCGGPSMVANGRFDQAFLGDWVEFDADGTVVAGRLRATATADGDQDQQVRTNVTLVNGCWYRVTGQGFAGTEDAVVDFSSQALDPQINTAFDLVFQSISTLIQIQCKISDSLAINIGDFAEFDNIAVYPYTVETDSAFALNRLDTGFVGRADETDSAFARVPGFPAVRSNETDTAFARSAIFIRTVGRADEVDSAFQLNRLVTVPLGRSDETSSAFRLGFGSPAARANEADTAFACVALITIDHGFSIENDTAFQMFGALEAGSGRKPHTRGNQAILRDRRQPVHKTL